jgi:hypothetical protein
MPWLSNGTFQRVNPDFTGATVWQQDQQATIKIIASRHDSHDEDLAQGIANALNLDGYNAMRASLNLGDNKLINVLAGTVDTDGVNKAQMDAADATLQSGIDANTAAIGTKLEDAPSDGNIYGRENGAWAVVPTGIGDAPSDNNYYSRRNAAWEVSPTGIGDAPSDGNQYVRQDAAWEIAAAGIGDAPADNDYYGRQNNAWVSLPFLQDAPNDANTYGRQGGAWVIIPGGVGPDDLITAHSWDKQTFSSARVNGGPITTDIRGFTEFASDGLIRHKLNDQGDVSSASIDVSAASRHSVINTGGVQLSFAGIPTLDDDDLGSTYQQEGQIVIHNGTGAGTVTFAGIVYKEIGLQSTADDVDQILSYIIQRRTAGYEATLIWSN